PADLPPSTDLEIHMVSCASPRAADGFDQGELALNDLKPYWVGCNLVKGIGPQRLRALLNTFGDVQSAWLAPAGERKAAGLSPKIVQSLLQVRSSVDLEKALQRIEKLGVTVLTWDDESYPRLLREIDQPPPVLYLRGEIRTVDEWAVGVVGTRRVTAYG